MPWFTKKERRRQVSAFPAIFKVDFGRFRHVSAIFRPVSAVSATGRYDLIWPIRPDFGRISPVRRKSKPIQHESSRIGANRVESVRIREKKNKKKKNANAVRHAGNHVGRHVTHLTASDAGAAPLVPCPCINRIFFFFFSRLKIENLLVIRR